MVDVKDNKLLGKLKLNSISIQNLATFENQTFEFSDGFSAIVGETGSGKSLILDSIQLLLGGRADKKLIRKGADFAVVEGSFSYSDKSINQYFDDIGYPAEGNTLTIKRIVYSNGKSKAFLNFHSCSVSTLLKLSRAFIDIVGQFENQKLLSSEYHLSLLDSFEGKSKELKQYQDTWHSLSISRKKLVTFYEKRESYEREKDYIEFQVNQLKTLSPDAEEELSLIEQKEKYLHQKKIGEAYTQSTEALSGSHNSISSRLGSVISIIKSSGDYDEDILSELESAQATIEDASYKLAKEVDQDFSEEDFEEVISRLDLYQKTKRKFKCESTEDLIKVFKELSETHQTYDNIDQEIKILEKECSLLESKARSIATVLSKSRSNKAKRLSKRITDFVRTLNMNEATIEFRVEHLEELNENGLDDVTIFAETNPGEDFHRIKDIASGGELSRILLALRNVIASHDSISIFLFDEIDTGIGGETALCIGRALSEVAEKSQVIAITHLPQIAGFADLILLIKKEVKGKKGNKRTVSTLQHVEEKGRKKALEAMSPTVH